ncbi:alpha/beta hydrolase [Novosphingobium sediminis]|uniref:Alpha/beta hydrolase n=1 Tax=Novosphingobium sediminis TaxID=707214 RepID=A0A512AFU0_9SPHN|nr:alpha/beta fold hydrolase [Novosphingobium sediminis]GEN98553.1 alpha/beta hydrolase [Novosphingobium sediminis]
MLRRILRWTGALALIACAALAIWLYAPDKPRSALEATYPGDYRTVLGQRLRYRDTGPKDAPALILLHGFGSSLETWEPWAKVLSAKYRVIRLDLPGFGLTGPDATGDYSDARTLTLIAGLIDQLAVPRAVLIGNSLGGRFAWEFAARYPQRVAKLVLISPDGFASPGFEYGKAPEVPFVMNLMPWVGPRSLIRANLAPAWAHPDALPDAVLDRYRDMLLAPGVRRAILDRTRQTVLTDPAPRLRSIAAPTLLLWGEQDQMIPIRNAQDYLSLMPHARLVRLPGMGHVPFEESPAAVLPPLRAFLAEPAP